MRRFVGVAAGLLVLGCGRGSAARDRATDSTTVVAPPVQPDSSTLPQKASASAPTNAATKTPTKAAAAPLTGYDSAFGPTFTVDSTGKVTPIGKKKP